MSLLLLPEPSPVHLRARALRRGDRNQCSGLQQVVVEPPEELVAARARMPPLKFDDVYFAASAAESDLDFTYRVQLQEALAASLFDQPSSSSLLPPPPTEDTSMPSAFDLRDGDNIKNPIAASDAGTSGGEEETFKLYFKGLASEEAPGIAAIGVSLCNPYGIVVMKIQKLVPLAGNKILDATAFVEGLHVALSLGITCLDIFIDAVSLYNHVRVSA